MHHSFPKIPEYSKRSVKNQFTIHPNRGRVTKRRKEAAKSGVRAYHATPRTTRLHQRGPAVVKIESMRRYTLSRCSAARRSMRPRQIRARCTCTLVDQPSPIERPTSNSRKLHTQCVSSSENWTVSRLPRNEISLNYICSYHYVCCNVQRNRKRCQTLYVH